MLLDEEVRKINKLLEKIDKTEKVAIWGAGENTVKLFQYTDIMQYNIKQVIDSTYEDTFFGYQVKNPQHVQWKDVDVVVVSSFYCEQEIVKLLKDAYNFSGKIITLNTENTNKPFYAHLSKKMSEIPKEYKEIIARNETYKNAHRGQRVFILCTGPSVCLLDLKKLSNEVCIAVSNFYLHNDFDAINPKYYCIPGITYNKRMTEEIVTNWMKDIEKHANNAEFFFSIREKSMLESHNLFTNNTVNYLYPKWSHRLYDDIDLCNTVFECQSVPIMCIQLALYMGFKEIYLVGTEHRELITQDYTYFYKGSKSKVHGCDVGLKKDGKHIKSYSETLIGYYTLWEQYRVLQEIAQQKQVEIYNATPETALDVFQKVDFNSLF